MLLSNAIRSLFKQFLESEKSCSVEYSAMGCAHSASHEDVGKNQLVKAQIRKAVEAERLQVYLERIVDRIVDLEKLFECETKVKPEGHGAYLSDAGDYRMNQARDRLLRLQLEAKVVKNRINCLKYQLYYDF